MLYLDFYIPYSIVSVAAVTSGRVICVGKHSIPYDENEVKIADKIFSPLLCENCNTTAERVHLMNNGLQLVFNLTYDDASKIPTLSNEPLQGKGKYCLHGVNFNWLFTTPDDWAWYDIKFPAELHITFYNGKHKDFKTAVNANEGIAILSMRFRVSEEGVGSTNPIP